MHMTIERLRNLCRRLLAEGDLEFKWFGSKLDDFLCHRCRSLEEALGLRFARGGIPWWREEATRKRDAALRALTERYFSEQRLSVQAKRVYEQAVRYAASAWRRDRLCDAMPAQYVGTMREWLWAAFASGAPMPIRERRLRDVLQRADRQRDCCIRHDETAPTTYALPGDERRDGCLPHWRRR